MAELIIYGASDDLIEFSGAIYEEFAVYAPEIDDDPVILAVSDGSLFRVRYDEDGIWRFTPVVIGSSTVTIDQGRDDRDHTDRITLVGDDLRWVVLGTQVAKSKGE
jgi:hypothetical protein